MSDHAPNPLSVAVISLMKGVVERETSPALWQTLITHQAKVRDHVAVIGLELALDEAEGFAFLRQRPAAEGEPELPRLIARRRLSYLQSLLLALLRKKLAEFDAQSGEKRLVVTSAEMFDMIRLFLPDTANDARLRDQVNRAIGRTVDLGFLRPLTGRDRTYEVKRILRSFVDAQWLGQFNERLNAYAVHGREGVDAEDQDSA